MNGDIKEDEEREWMYAGGRGELVIDCAIGDEITRKKIRSMVVGRRVESDYTIRYKKEQGGGEIGRKKEKGISRKVEVKTRGDWVEEWRGIRDRIKEALEGVGEKKRRLKRDGGTKNVEIARREWEKN